MDMPELPNQPTISVVIPTRNRSSRLVRAINDVHQQSLQALDIIVIDDASTDDTAAVLADLTSPSLQVIRNGQRLGAAQSRNLGIAAARGEFLAFLDDDDRWHPDKLAVQAFALSQAAPSVALVCCAYDIVSDITGRLVRTWQPPTRPIDLAYFLRTTGFMTTVPLMRRSCIQAVGGFDPDLTGGQDLDLWIRLAGHYSMISVPQVLAEHHIHGNQITTDLHAKARASALIIRKHRPLLSDYPDLLRRQLERAGYLHCAAGQPEAGRGYLLEAMSLSDSPEELAKHLEASQHDPKIHAEALIGQVFPEVDGVRLYY